METNDASSSLLATTTTPTPTTTTTRNTKSTRSQCQTIGRGTSELTRAIQVITSLVLALNVLTDCVLHVTGAMNLPDGIENVLGFVPRSTFQCERDGYFGDTDNDCRIFHLCQKQVNPSGRTEWRHWTYACGNQTMFNQLTLTCAFVDEAIPCKHASQFQYLNEVIHKPREPFLTDADVTSGISYYSNRIMSDGARARAFRDSSLMAQLGGGGGGGGQETRPSTSVESTENHFRQNNNLQHHQQHLHHQLQQAQAVASSNNHFQVQQAQQQQLQRPARQQLQEQQAEAANTGAGLDSLIERQPRQQFVTFTDQRTRQEPNTFQAQPQPQLQQQQQQQQALFQHQRQSFVINHDQQPQHFIAQQNGAQFSQSIAPSAQNQANNNEQLGTFQQRPNQQPQFDPQPFQAQAAAPPPPPIQQPQAAQAAEAQLQRAEPKRPNSYDFSISTNHQLGSGADSVIVTSANHHFALPQLSAASPFTPISNQEQSGAAAAAATTENQRNFELESARLLAPQTAPPQTTTFATTSSATDSQPTTQQSTTTTTATGSPPERTTTTTTTTTTGLAFNQASSLTTTTESQPATSTEAVNAPTDSSTQSTTTTTTLATTSQPAVTNTQGNAAPQLQLRPRQSTRPIRQQQATRGNRRFDHHHHQFQSTRITSRQQQQQQQQTTESALVMRNSQQLNKQQTQPPPTTVASPVSSPIESVSGKDLTASSKPARLMDESRLQSGIVAFESAASFWKKNPFDFQFMAPKFESMLTRRRV